MALPFEPPLEPMLAKAADALPDGRRLAVRAEVGRLPRARLPRRRRDLHAVARPQAARPLLPRTGRPAAGRAARSAASSTARSSSPRDGALAVRVPAPAHPPGRVARQDARRGVAGAASSPGTCSRSATRTCARRPQGERRARLEAVLGGVEPPIHLTPATRDRATAPDWFERLRGRRARRRRREATRRAVPAGQAGDAQDQAPAHRRLRRGRLPLAQERARAPTSGRCCSGSTTTRARSTTSGSRRRSRGTGAPRSPRSWRRCARTRSRAIRGASGPNGRRRRRRGVRPAPAGRHVALEPRQGPVVGAAPRRTGRRGRLRPPPGRPLPARRRRSSAGARTSRPRTAATTSSRRRAPFLLASIFGGRGLSGLSRLGLVGGGWISRLHLEALERLRPDRARRGRRRGRPRPADAVTARWGGARYDDVDAMLDHGEARCRRTSPCRRIGPSPIGERLVARRHPVPDREAARGRRTATGRPAWRTPSSEPGSSSPSAITCARSTSWPRSATGSPAAPPQLVVARWLDSTPAAGLVGPRRRRAAARSSSRRRTCTTWRDCLIGEATVVGAASTRDIGGLAAGHRRGRQHARPSSASTPVPSGPSPTRGGWRRPSSRSSSSRTASSRRSPSDPSAARATGTPAFDDGTAIRAIEPTADPYEKQAAAFLDAVEAGDPSRVLSTYADALKTDRLTRAVVAATGAPG